MLNVILGGLFVGLLFFFYSLITDILNRNKVTVITSEANIRNGPSPSSKIIKVVNFGDNLKVLEKNGHWFKVEYRHTSSVMIGYIHERKVQSLTKKKDSSKP